MFLCICPETMLWHFHALHGYTTPAERLSQEARGNRPVAQAVALHSARTVSEGISRIRGNSLRQGVWVRRPALPPYGVCTGYSPQDEDPEALRPLSADRVLPLLQGGGRGLSDKSRGSRAAGDRRGHTCRRRHHLRDGAENQETPDGDSRERTA